MNVEKIKQYGHLMRLHRPIGILLLLWPTLWALWLGGQGQPKRWTTFLFVLGVIVMRSAGCIMNDMADRHIDGHVARTCLRPLVTGKVTPREAFRLLIFLLLFAFIIVLFFNRYTILLALAGLFFAAIYPFMKRFTHLPQAGLGIAFSWGVPMAFAAQNEVILARDWVVFVAAVFWPIIYDTFYAMVDQKDDIKIGVKSTAILFHEKEAVIIGCLQIIFLVLLGWVGKLFQLHTSYYYSLLMVGGLFLYQQVLMKDSVPEKCFKAFLNNNWVGFFIFLGIVLSYYQKSFQV